MSDNIYWFNNQAYLMHMTRVFKDSGDVQHIITLDLFINDDETEVWYVAKSDLYVPKTKNENTTQRGRKVSDIMRRKPSGAQTTKERKKKVKIQSEVSPGSDE